MYVPEDWNRNLVLYAHGFRARQYSIALPDIEPLRDALLGEGFALAMSSYSKTGWAVKEGSSETKGLLPLFFKRFGRPARTYVIGHSMGGLISLRLVEKHPGLFDGALPMCGAVGGTNLVNDHVTHVRVLFDYFYPEILPGPTLMPDVLDPRDAMFSGWDAMEADLRPVPGWYEIGLIQGLDLPSDPFLVFDAILWRLWGNGGTDLLSRTRGKAFWDNMDVWYTGSQDDDDLNALVERFRAHPRGLTYTRLWYEPTGRLRVPTLTLHNLIDPLVPMTHEDEYAERVASWGKSHKLVQRISSAVEYGHCDFTLEEEIAAFLDLVNWVENGVPPTP
jgi:pimeloyl-ACP methyl ester carboxylesterase